MGGRFIHLFLNAPMVMRAQTNPTKSPAAENTNAGTALLVESDVIVPTTIPSDVHKIK